MQASPLNSVSYGDRHIPYTVDKESQTIYLHSEVFLSLSVHERVTLVTSILEHHEDPEAFYSIGVTDLPTYK